MNKRMISRILGELLMLESTLLLLPFFCGLIYGETEIVQYAMCIAITFFAGLILYSVKVTDKKIYAMEGFVIVALGWILLSMFGGLPFFLTHEIPNYIDCVFETVSGFTTTGSSILTNVEALSKASLFWRSFTHWIGGMGILVFIMAIIPLSKGGSDLHLMRAESPGPDVGKIVPKSKSSAAILYKIYLVMTVIQIVLLKLGGMPLFDSLTITFGTAGTGGFSVLNSGCASYPLFCQIVITVFMALFGVNFSLYYLLICGKIKSFFKSEELRAYFAIMIGAILIIAVNITGMFGNFWEALHQSSFQVSSIMTTTGFSTTDFNKWPDLSRYILILVMCVGACAGSTGGGIKVSRLVIILKNIKREIRRLAHPKSITPITFDGKRLDERIIQGTNVYLGIYVIILIVSVLIVSFDKTDILSNVSGVIATFNNIGPGLSQCGPAASFADFSYLSKIIFIFDMLLGRLEIFPIILLFTSCTKRYRRK